MQEDQRQPDNFQQEFRDHLSIGVNEKPKSKRPKLIAIIVGVLLLVIVCVVTIISFVPNTSMRKYQSFANYITSGNAQEGGLSQSIQSFALADHSRELNDANRKFYAKSNKLVDDFLATYKKADLKIEMNPDVILDDFAIQFEITESDPEDELESDEEENISNERDSYYPTEIDNGLDDDKNKLTADQNNLANQIASFKLLNSYFANTAPTGNEILNSYLSQGKTVEEFAAKYQNLSANQSIIDDEKFIEYIKSFSYNSTYTMKFLGLLYARTANEIQAVISPNSELAKEHSKIETELQQLVIYMSNEIAKNSYKLVNIRTLF